MDGRMNWLDSSNAKTSASPLKAKGCLTYKTCTDPALNWSFLTAHHLIFTFCRRAATCLKARETKVWKIYQPPNHPLNQKMSKAKYGSRSKDGYLVGLYFTLCVCVCMLRIPFLECGCCTFVLSRRDDSVLKKSYLLEAKNIYIAYVHLRPS